VSRREVADFRATDRRTPLLVSMRNMIPLVLLAAACAAPGGGNPGDDTSGGPDGGSSSHPRWDGTSHITAADGAIYDSSFVFAYDYATGSYDVASGLVNITKQPTFSGDCTITIDSSHPIAQHDGMLQVTDGPGVAGQGTTVWAATYTAVCPNVTSTTMQPYAAYWWPNPSDPTPNPAPGGMVTIPINEQLGSGTVTLTEE